MLPNFRYQLQLASGEPQRRITDRATLRRLLCGMYGGRGPNRELAFNTKDGILYDNLPKIGPSPILSEEESDFYADEYNRNKLSNLNWYKTSKINFEEELNLEKSTIEIPTMFLCATKDDALPPWMSAKMEERIPKLRRHEVEAGHWVLWQKPVEANQIIKNFLEETYFKDLKSKL